ncbi:hypothetical protein MPER_04289 [Moniliophthora perniciosa FA553]|nr:hypothetical protein MPER_04289 [Moniliophthora perniciosa FA553]
MPTRDGSCADVAYKLGWLIDPSAILLVSHLGVPALAGTIFKWASWLVYWYCQSIILAGWWCMAHEAGHGNISSYQWVNHLIGFSLHTFVMAPYYSWRASHHAHHRATVSIERDENYVPRTRSDYGLPPEPLASARDYHEIFEETPVYTLARMIFMQLLGWQVYLFTDTSGSPRHPPGTNHFSPSSPLFKLKDRYGIIASNIGLTFMACVLYLWTKQVGTSAFLKLYFVPYIVSYYSVSIGFF